MDWITNEMWLNMHKYECCSIDIGCIINAVFYWLPLNNEWAMYNIWMGLESEWYEYFGIVWMFCDVMMWGDTGRQHVINCKCSSFIQHVLFYNSKIFIYITHNSFVIGVVCFQYKRFNHVFRSMCIGMI